MFQSFCSIRVLNTIDTYVNYQNGFDEHGFTLSEKSYNRIDQLKFKRLSIYVYSPSRCTLGYVGYNLYNSENVIIDPQEKSLVPTDLVLICPKGVYSIIAPRAIMAMKKYEPLVLVS